MGGEMVGPVIRPLLEKGNDTFVRYNQAIPIIKKIFNPDKKSFDTLVSSQTPFGIVSSYKGMSTKIHPTDLLLYKSGHEMEHRGQTAYVQIERVIRGKEYIHKHKVYLGEASSAVGSFPHAILTQPFYGEPGSVCTQSYLVIGPFDNKNECENCITYIKTRLFRFMVLQRKNTQHNMSHVFKFVPLQDFSHPWTDAILYEKYGLEQKEIDFIESMIRPME
jgi:site-specific DNA-methyltransferase (adenine-specific)